MVTRSPFSPFQFQHRRRQVIDLLAEYFAEHFLGHPDFLETRMRHNHGIPIAGGDLGEQLLPLFLLEVGFFSNQNIGVG